MENFFANLTAIAPHLIAIVAIIVPAVVSAKERKYDLEEKRIEWITSQWAAVYFDFCSNYAKYIAQGYPKEVGSDLAACAFKLTAICDNQGAECLRNLAAWVSRGDGNDIDTYTLYSMFESSAKAVQKALIAPTLPRLKPGPPSLPFSRSGHGSLNKKSNQK